MCLLTYSSLAKASETRDEEIFLLKGRREALARYYIEKTYDRYEISRLLESARRRHNQQKQVSWSVVDGLRPASEWGKQLQRLKELGSFDLTAGSLGRYQYPSDYAAMLPKHGGPLFYEALMENSEGLTTKQFATIDVLPERIQHALNDVKTGFTYRDPDTGESYMRYFHWLLVDEQRNVIAGFRYAPGRENGTRRLQAYPDEFKHEQPIIYDLLKVKGIESPIVSIAIPLDRRSYDYFVKVTDGLRELDRDPIIKVLKEEQTGSMYLWAPGGSAVFLLLGTQRLLVPEDSGTLVSKGERGDATPKTYRLTPWFVISGTQSAREFKDIKAPELERQMQVVEELYRVGGVAVVKPMSWANCSRGVVDVLDKYTDFPRARLPLFDTSVGIHLGVEAKRRYREDFRRRSRQDLIRYGRRTELTLIDDWWLEKDRVLGMWRNEKRFMDFHDRWGEHGRNMWCEKMTIMVSAPKECSAKKARIEDELEDTWRQIVDISGELADYSRQWTLRTGKRFYADLIAIEDDVGRVKLASHRTLDIPLNSLSDVDQKFVQSFGSTPGSGQVWQPSSRDATPTETFDRVVETLAAQWTLRALNLKQEGTDELIEMVTWGEDMAIERQMAQCLAMSSIEIGSENRLKLEQIRMGDLSLRIEMLTHEFRARLISSEHGSNWNSSDRWEVAAGKVEDLRNGFLGKGETVLVMSPDLARAITHWELIGNRMMTPELAASLVKCAVSRAEALENEDQLFINDIEMQMNLQIDPSRAALVRNAASALEAARSKDLEESRRRVKNLLRRAVANEPTAKLAFAHAGAIRAHTSNQELLESRRQLESRIEDTQKQ